MLVVADVIGVNGKLWVVGYSGGGMHAWAALEYIPDRLQDLNNFGSDPEVFARTLCKDLHHKYPKVGIAIQCVKSARETRIGKKGHRGGEQFSTSIVNGTALDLMKLFGGKSSILRKRKEWDLYKPVVDNLTKAEVKALDAREERNAHFRTKLNDKEELYLMMESRVKEVAYIHGFSSTLMSVTNTGVDFSYGGLSARN